MIVARPWFGSGLGTWPVKYPAYAIIDTGAFANRAYADWLEWSAEGGLPFGIAMATLFVWCLRPAFDSVWGIGAIAVFVSELLPRLRSAGRGSAAERPRRRQTDGRGHRGHPGDYGDNHTGRQPRRARHYCAARDAAPGTD